MKPDFQRQTEQVALSAMMGGSRCRKPMHVARKVLGQATDEYVGILLAVVEHAHAERGVTARQHRACMGFEQARREIRTDDLH